MDEMRLHSLFFRTENTDIEPIKGGLSDSFKRAACVWGIGRYLYELGGIWVEVEQRGKSSVIKDTQYAKLESEYNRAIAKMFGSTDNQEKTPAPEKKTAPVSPAADTRQPTPTAPSFEYLVQSVKPSGKASQLLELVDTAGEVISAYIKNSDTAVKPGSKLQNVAIVPKESSYGQYNLISGYRIAA